MLCLFQAVRYFIALMLKGEEKDRVDRLRFAIAERFGKSVVPKVPPHITLLQPFETVASPDIITDAVADLADELLVQQIDVKGFADFHQKICFIDIEQRKRMADLKKDFETRLRKSIAWIPDEYDKEVHFHITLSYEDTRSFLKTEKVPLKKITFDSFSLLQHDGLRWQEIERFPFRSAKE